MTTTGYQLWTVPATRSYIIRCAGAGTANGLGIIIETTVNLTQGQKIQILVGQQGIRYQTGSSGGCGGSFVASGSTPATGVVLVAAGGGGGTENPSSGGFVANATTSTTGNTSSDGTGAGGSSGGGGSGSSSGWGGGGGGFTGNGTDATYQVNSRGFSFVNGGLGGTTATTADGGFGGGAGTHGNTGGGGGGGGYSGGGGSGQTNTGLGGGGGSYPSGATNIGTNSGPGYVIITAATAITVPITSISPITYATPTYSYGTQYGISVQTSNIQGKLSPATTAVATWLAQPTITSVTMTGLTFSIVASASGATGYIYNVIGTPATTPPTVTNTTGSFTCAPLVRYVANVYATATNSQSILSANSASVWCLTTPVITVGTHTNNIYTGGTRIVGTTFTIIWTAGDANATSYTINLNGTGTQNTTASLTTSYAVTVNNSYYAIVKATATNSTSQIASTAIIYCLTAPTITEGASSTYISGTTFTIVWTAGDANAASYTLYINGAYSSIIASPTVTTTVSVTAGNSYYATVYATASYSTSAASTNSSTIYCLATPSLTVGSGTNNIYNAGTFISGTTFTATWSTITNATGYTVVFYNFNTGVTATTTTNSSTFTRTLAVSSPNRYNVTVSATATYSTSSTSTASSTIYCLTAPSITSGTTIGGSLGTTFTITWTAGDANASGYTIFLNGSGTPNTTNSSTLTTPFTVSRGSTYYATVYATATYSTSVVSTTSTIPCILHTYTLSMSSASTLTASVSVTPTGYTYSTTALTLYKNNIITSPAVTGSPFTSLVAGNDYSVGASSTTTSSSSGTIISPAVPCILLTITLSMSGSTLTPSTAITPATSSYDATSYSYTLLPYSLYANDVAVTQSLVPPTLLTSLTASASSTSACTSGSFTAAAGSVIVVFSGVEQTSTVTLNVNSISGLGLTWTKHYASGMKPGYNIGVGSQQQEIWYAINNTTNSISDTITVNYSTTFDDQAMVIASFSGCDLSNPWLSGGDATAAGTTGTPTVTLPAINKANTLALAFTGTNYNIGPNNYTSGWTNLNAITNGGADYWEYIAVSYKTFTTSQAAQSISAISTSNYWIYITSVLVGASAVTSSSNFTDLTAGTYYSVSASATNYGLTEHFEMTSITTNSGQWTNYNPTWNDWTFYGAGIAIAGCTWQPPGSAAKTGKYYAFLQSDGAYISHRLTGVVGATATLTFSYSYRNVTAIPTSYSVYWIPDSGSQVTISTATIGTLTGWADVTTTWTFSSYYAGLIKFVNNSSGVGDNALLIDNIKVTFPSTNSSSGTKTSGSVYCLATPVAPTITFAGTTVTVNWSAVANVNSTGNAYLFYYNGTNVPAVITPSNTGTPFTSATSSVTSLTNGLGTTGSSYYIQMLAIGPNTVSALSAASSTIFCLATPVISSISISELVLSLSWGAITNANNYSIYLNGSGSVINVGNTTSTTIAVVLGGNSYYCRIFATNTGTSSAGVDSSTVYTHGVFTAAPTSYFIGSGVSGTSCTLSNNNSTVNYSTSQRANVSGKDFYFIVNTNFGSKPSNNVNWSFTAGRNKNRTLTITGYTGANATGTATTLGTFTNTGTSNSGSISPGTGTASIYVSIPSFTFINGSTFTYDFTFTLTITD